MINYKCHVTRKQYKSDYREDSSEEICSAGFWFGETLRWFHNLILILLRVRYVQNSRKTACQSNHTNHYLCSSFMTGLHSSRTVPSPTQQTISYLLLIHLPNWNFLWLDADNSLILHSKKLEYNIANNDVIIWICILSHAYSVHWFKSWLHFQWIIYVKVICYDIILDLMNYI